MVRGYASRDVLYAYVCVRCKKKRVKEKAGSGGGRVSPSCSDRGRETNAAPVSVLVSRTPPTPRFRRFSAFRSAGWNPPPRRGRGGCSRWAVPVRATPRRVARLPARRARQMFFVADYDAVCAIMTTSPPSPSLSFPSPPSCACSLSSYPCSFVFFSFLFFFFFSSFPPIFKRFPPRGWISLPLSLFLSFSLQQHRGSFQDARFALAPARRTRAFRCCISFLVLVPTNAESVGRSSRSDRSFSLSSRGPSIGAAFPWIFLMRIESRCRFWEARVTRYDGKGIRGWMTHTVDANSNRVSRFFVDIGNRIDRIVSLCSSTGVPVDYWERRGERKEISEEKFLLDRSR